MNLATNKRWSDQYLPRIKEIVGGMLLTAAPLELDMKENTDLMVLDVDVKKIACRIRRPGFLSFRNEFTIRSKAGGPKTEIDKIKEGFGDWLFYGHAGQAPGHVLTWMIIDLDFFRTCLKDGMEGREIANHDGTKFMVFNVRNFPKSLVIKRG